MFLNSNEIKIFAFREDENNYIVLCKNQKYLFTRAHEEESIGTYGLNQILDSIYRNKIYSIIVNEELYKLEDQVRIKGLNTKDPFIIKRILFNADYEITIKVQNINNNEIKNVFPLTLSKKTKEEIEEEIEDEKMELKNLSFENHPDEISEDGFNLYLGDKCVIVNKNFNIIESFIGKNSKGLVFSSIENANNYVLYNKELFTLQDLLDLIPEKEKELIELAKSKI